MCKLVRRKGRYKICIQVCLLHLKTKRKHSGTRNDEKHLKITQGNETFIIFLPFQTTPSRNRGEVGLVLDIRHALAPLVFYRYITRSSPIKRGRSFRQGVLSTNPDDCVIYSIVVPFVRCLFFP